MIKYSPKSDRAFDSVTGRFVSYSKARLSSVFRTEYEPILLKRKVEQLEKGLIEKEELIKQLEARRIPEKEWILVIPKAELLSPLMMYVELQGKLSKREYQKVVAEVQKQTTSNKKLRILRTLYNKKLGIE